MRTLTYVSLVGALVILTPMTVAAAAIPGGGSGPCVVSYTPGASYLTITPPGCVYQGRGHVFPSNVPHSIRMRHLGFVSVVTEPGGVLGGHLERFGSDILVQIDDGPEVRVPAQVAVSSAPFEDGKPFVTFATSMDRLEGQISGDPVFEYFSIRAGGELVGDSPGQTTITSDSETKTAVVNSIFNIEYEIEFQGAAGGPLEGYGGVFTGTATMEAFGDK